MRFDPDLEGGEEADRRPVGTRLLWLLFFWLGGVGVVGAVAWLIRLWIAPSAS